MMNKHTVGSVAKVAASTFTMMLLMTSPSRAMSGVSQGQRASSISASYTDLNEKAWDQKHPASANAVVYQDLRNGLVPGLTVSSGVLDMRYSAKALVGAAVHSGNGELIARVDDITLDKSGYAQKIVLSGGGASDFGKIPIILNYDDVINVSATMNDASVVKPVSIVQLKNAAVYDGRPGYDQMPVSVLTGSDVKDTAGDTVARIDDVVFSRKTGAYFAVSYGQVRANGQALMAYKDLAKVSLGKGTYIQLTQEQTEFFETYLLNGDVAPQIVSVNVGGLVNGVGFNYWSAVAVRDLVGDAKAVAGHANDALDKVFVRIERVRKDDDVSAPDNWFRPTLHQYGVTYE